MTPADVGDALNAPESIKLDAYWRDRKRARRACDFAGVRIVALMFYNRGWWRKGLIVVVARGDGPAARAALAGVGLREVRP